jgi:hypothetical protein
MSVNGCGLSTTPKGHVAQPVLTDWLAVVSDADQTLSGINASDGRIGRAAIRRSRSGQAGRIRLRDFCPARARPLHRNV